MNGEFTVQLVIFRDQQGVWLKTAIRICHVIAFCGVSSTA